MTERHPPPGTAADLPDGCDVVIVGAGIIGLATARELLHRHPGLDLVVLEREPQLAAHQTGHSSGVIHAGIYYQPGSLKARLCVEGARDLYAYCEERRIPFERNGKVIVAISDDEVERLDELERRGRANAVPGLRRIGPDELRGIEPHATGVAALHSPHTGIVDFAAVARSLAADAVDAGARISPSSPVTSTAASAGRIELRNPAGSITARAAIFCAGAWADRLAVAAGAPRDPRIVPFRGSYLRLRPERRNLVRTNIYPVPDPDLPFLGMHLTRTIAGEVLLGPSALMVASRDGYRLRRVGGRDLATTLGWPGTWRLARRWWRTGVGEIRMTVSRRAFVRDLARYVPELRTADVLPGPAGVRAQALARDGALVDDFVVHSTDRALHVRNAPSPAATSSLALARLIADRAERELGISTT